MTFIEKIPPALYVVVGVIALVVGFNVLAAKHDVAVAQAASQYEKCVREQYHTTPSAWREQHGEYPSCQ